MTRSTETLERLEKKLKGYEDLQIASGYAYWVLFRFGHPRREAGARADRSRSHRSGGDCGPGANTAVDDAMWAPNGARRVPDAPDRAGWRAIRPSPTDGSRRPMNIASESTNNGGAITPIVTERRDHRSRS